MEKKPEVVGLGASTLDVVNLVEDYPIQEGVQEADDMILQGGGPVATAMVTLSRLGVPVAMLDNLGDDWAGKFILSEFQTEGVSTDHIHIASDRTSSLSTILVRKNGERSIIHQRGSAPEFSPEDLPERVIRSARILHLNGRHWDACLQACNMARKHQILISFDGGADRYQSKFAEIIPSIDICIVARDFAEKHTRSRSIEIAAQLLLNQGPSLVVITEGIRGSWIYSDEGEAFHQPAFEVSRIVDTTGAGDVYHGAFLYGVLKGLGLRESARMASVAASMKCGSLGGRSGIPRLPELIAYLPKFDGMV